ncbi:kinase-like protein [Whalleya microplaca]|nr:kinase-like protein [Whalleya microplaca]
MELIPYTSREGREIVLRHHNTLVVRDPSSQQVEVRALTECPTCHQSLRPTSPDRHFDIPSQHESFVDPSYFRVLQAGHNEGAHRAQRQPPSSPIRRLTQPALPVADGRLEEVDDIEFISSTPAPQEGARIRRDAFSPDYFSRFFVEEKELGRGGKGVVLLVRHEIDGCALGHFACKRVPVGDDHAWLEKVLIEVELLAKLSHPNLVSYRHVWLEDVKLNRFGPSVACAFILQQYCNHGDLLRYVIGDQPRQVTKEQLKAQIRRRSKGTSERPHDVLLSPRGLPFEEIYSLFKDITSGLTYLHSSNYIHRDLKPSNCLLHLENGKLTCLISDFGEVQPRNAERNSTGTTGTISYCAPEVLKRDAGGNFGNFTTKSDVFSLGMILYFLCFGRLPYLSANTIQEELEDIDQLRAEIVDWKGFRDERRERPELPTKLYQLLKKMLALDPNDRPSAAEVLSVMNHESNHGGQRGGLRATSPPPLGPHSRRVQSLDSPMPPSTPVPDPIKHHPNDMEADEDFTRPTDISSPLTDHSPQSTLQNSLQKYPTSSTTRHRPQAMMLSRSQEGFTRASPDRDHHATAIAHSPSPITNTPLLMAPPTGPFGTLRQQAMLTWHRSIYFSRTHVDSIRFVFRFILFLTKMISLARPCWPFMVNLGVGVPLISIAAIDLGAPFHHSPIVVSHEGASRRHGSMGSFRWTWDWKVSAVLSVFHFLVLWSVTRWGILCAAYRDVWLEW